MKWLSHFLLPFHALIYLSLSYLPYIPYPTYITLPYPSLPYLVLHYLTLLQFILPVSQQRTLPPTGEMLDLNRSAMCCLRAVGEYTIGVKFNDEHVPRSPCKITIDPECVEAKAVSIQALRDRGIEVSSHTPHTPIYTHRWLSYTNTIQYNTQIPI